MKYLVIFILFISCVSVRSSKYFPNYENSVNENKHDALKNIWRILYKMNKRCANLGGDDCINGYLPFAGDDRDYLGSGNNPGKRCANLHGDDCANGYLLTAGSDDDYLGSGNTPGKRNIPNFYSKYMGIYD